MGSNCCRASSTDLVGEKRTEKTDAILQGLQNEEVKRKVQELEDLAFMGSTGLVHHRVDSRGDEEAFFVGVLERLENSDEFDSNSPFTSEIGEDESDGDVVGQANSEKRSRVCSSTVDDDVYVMPEVGSVEEDLPLAEWELGAAWNQLRHCELPKLGICMRLIQGVARLYAAGSALVHLPAPPLNGRVVIVGDLHGHFGDLCHILDAFGEPSAGPGGTQYLFNGDFVDRGSWGPELLLTLYCLKLRHPRAVHFNRGNHEDIKQNQMPANGFRDAHCTRAFGKDGPQVFKLCLRSFGQLPLCHVLNNEIAVIHGGLPLDPSITLSDIETIRRQREIPAHLYTVHGYREGQRIKARRLIPTTSGHLIEPGSLGQLLRRHMRTNCAIAQFDDLPGYSARVAIRGSPELEDEVEILFDSEEDREQQRSDRLFIALMWSDPIVPGSSSSSSGGPAAPGPNTKRGAGYCFDMTVTQGFLKANKLRCLVRSHEKQEHGSSVAQRAFDGSLLAVTVFSASNYPSGAGEPSGNKAGVVIVQTVESQGGSSLAVTSSVAWREPFMEMRRWKMPRMEKKFLERTRTQQLEEPHVTVRPSARDQALQQLWLLIYCARPALLKYFNAHDEELTGKASVERWISAMRACVIADEDFPWERLALYLAHFNPKGFCHYGAFLRRFQNALSQRLEARFCDGAMVQALSKLGPDLEPEQEWSAIDADGNGRLSYSEIRPLLRKHMSGSSLGIGADGDDDKAFALLTSMDKDLSGFVERDEFLLAMKSPSRSELVPEESMTLHHCWAALHGVLRALALAQIQADAIFHAMDTTQDGWLSREEFQEGLELVLHGSACLQTLKDWEPLLWRLVDEDSSGHVSPEELAAALAVVDVTQRTGK